MSNDSNKAAVVYISLILLTSTLIVSAAEMKTVDDFRAVAAKANAILTIPDWEQTPEAIEIAMKNTIAKANASLDRIGAQDPTKVTFKPLDAASRFTALQSNQIDVLSRN